MRQERFWAVAALVTVVSLFSGCAKEVKPELTAGELLRSGVETFTFGCEPELATFCPDVTPGQGRLLACIYAHEDKISPQCGKAVLDAAVLIDRAVAKLPEIMNACASNLDTFCATVPAGEGRLIDCLIRNEAKLDPGCTQALAELK